MAHIVHGDDFNHDEADRILEAVEALRDAGRPTSEQVAYLKEHVGAAIASDWWNLVDEDSAMAYEGGHPHGPGDNRYCFCKELVSFYAIKVLGELGFYIDEADQDLMDACIHEDHLAIWLAWEQVEIREKSSK